MKRQFIFIIVLLPALLPALFLFFFLQFSRPLLSAYGYVSPATVMILKIAAVCFMRILGVMQPYMLFG
jgi:hypothetical protein